MQKIPGLPGTFLPGFKPTRLRPVNVRARAWPEGVRRGRCWMQGECKVLRFEDDDGLHMTISHPTRYPTWDEIKLARYRVLPSDRSFALVLPPPDDYVDTPYNPSCFELVEVEVAKPRPLDSRQTANGAAV